MSDEVEADLPGIDADANPDPAGPGPEEAGLPEWSEAELDDWFENVFGGHDAFENRFPGATDRSFSQFDHLHREGFHEALQIYARQTGTRGDLGLAGRLPWNGLRTVTKAQFRHGWEREFTDDPRNWPTGQIRPEDSIADLHGYDLVGQVTGVEPESSRRAARGWRAAAVAGGAAVVAVAVAVGVVMAGGSDDPDPAVTDDATAPATPIDDEPPPADESDPPAGDDAPDEPADDDVTAIDAGPIQDDIVILDDPVSQVTVDGATILVDEAGDVYVLADLAGAWIPGPPVDADVVNLMVLVGIANGADVHSTSWSLEPGGTTRGAGYIAGTERAALEGELWVDPAGDLLVKPPGFSLTGGLAAEGLLPDAQVVVSSQVILEEGGEIQRWDVSFPLGDVASADPPPLSVVVPIETTFGPVTLVIPGG